MSETIEAVYVGRTPVIFPGIGRAVRGTRIKVRPQDLGRRDLLPVDCSKLTVAQMKDLVRRHRLEVDLDQNKPELAEAVGEAIEAITPPEPAKDEPEQPEPPAAGDDTDQETD